MLKVKELIATLESYLAEHGNIPIAVETGEGAEVLTSDNLVLDGESKVVIIDLTVPL